MRRTGATVAMLLAIVSGALANVAGVTSAGADPLGSCTTSTGAIVAVDFSHWGGPTVRGCGLHPSSGYALLHAAGFSTVGDNHDGPGFICRIGNGAFAGGAQYPTPAEDACILTPPAAAYWSYWSAPAGQHTWSYSGLGATTHTPTAGEVDLWIFGGTDNGGTTGSGVPSFGPDSVRARNTTSPVPTPHSPPPAEPGPGSTARANVGAASGPGPNPAATSSEAGGPPPVPPTTVTSGGRAAVTTSTTRTSTSIAGTSTTIAATNTGRSSITDPSSAPKFVDALPTVRQSSSAGSIAPLLIAVGLIVVLAGGAGGARWRRRQQQQE